MDWITERIAIGNRFDAQDAELRKSAGFHAVISLDGSMTEERALALGYDDFVTANLIDGPGNDIDLFRRLLSALVALVEDSGPVLVHCHAGRSRSVTLVAAWLVTQRGMTTSSAYTYINQRREILVSAGLEELVSTSIQVSK